MMSVVLLDLFCKFNAPVSCCVAENMIKIIKRNDTHKTQGPGNQICVSLQSDRKGFEAAVMFWREYGFYVYEQWTFV